jgi:hypothetical protein
VVCLVCYNKLSLNTVMKNIVQPSEAGQIKDGQSQAKRTVLVQGGECPFCKKIV